jgi:hypothetical protein
MSAQEKDTKKKETKTANKVSLVSAKPKKVFHPITFDFLQENGGTDKIKEELNHLKKDHYINIISTNVVVIGKDIITQVFFTKNLKG